MSKLKWELRKVKKVVPAANFELICTFDNDVVKQFDFKPLSKKSGPMLEPLRKIAYFKKVFLEMGAPTWPNGFDICADLIFLEVKDLKRTRRPAA